MKKIMATLLSVLCLAGFVFAKPFVPVAPSALVSVIANDHITWYNEEEAGGFIQLAQRAKASELDDAESLRQGYTKSLMNGAKDAVINNLKEAGFEVVDEEAVLSSASYQSAVDNKMYVAAMNVSPANYKMISMRDKCIAGIAADTGANTTVLAAFTIQKIMDKGVGHNGQMKACCSIVLTFLDANGKMLKQYTGYASSANSIPVKMDNYDVDAFNELLPEAIDGSVKNAISKMMK